MAVMQGKGDRHLTRAPTHQGTAHIQGGPRVRSGGRHPHAQHGDGPGVDECEISRGGVSWDDYQATHGEQEKRSACATRGSR